MSINYELLSSIECFHKSTTDFLTGENPAYHRHEDTYELYMYIKGNTRLYVEDKCYILTPGSLILIKPGVLHRSIIEDNSPYERIGINISYPCISELSSSRTFLTECFEYQGNSRIITLKHAAMKSFINYVDEYLKQTESEEYGSDILCITSFTRLLIYVNMLYKEISPAKHKNVMPVIVTETMQYIDDNLTGIITLSDLSTHLNYSSNYIALKFKEHTGMTIRGYILDKRIENAKRYLIEGKNVSDACALSGFNDYANFIRTFKKMTGISPGHYSYFYFRNSNQI